MAIRHRLYKAGPSESRNPWQPAILDYFGIKICIKSNYQGPSNPSNPYIPSIPSIHEPIKKLSLRRTWKIPDLSRSTDSWWKLIVWSCLVLGLKWKDLEVNDVPNIQHSHFRFVEGSALKERSPSWIQATSLWFQVAEKMCIYIIW